MKKTLVFVAALFAPCYPQTSLQVKIDELNWCIAHLQQLYDLEEHPPFPWKDANRLPAIAMLNKKKKRLERQIQWLVVHIAMDRRLMLE